MVKDRVTIKKRWRLSRRMRLLINQSKIFRKVPSIKVNNLNRINQFKKFLNLMTKMSSMRPATTISTVMTRIIILRPSTKETDKALS